MLGIVLATRITSWLNLHEGECILVWLKTKGIYTSAKSRIEYNSVYDFYDLALFPSHQKYTQEMERAIDRLIQQYPDHITHKSTTWRWVTNEDTDTTEQMRGFRIWIKASNSILH